MNHADVPSMVARVLERPARWAPPGSFIGEYDGQERTLQVFNVDAREQLRLLEHLEPHRSLLEQVAGGPLVVMFFSVAQSVRYADTIAEMATSKVRERNQ
jgi:hypothetical protein